MGADRPPAALWVRGQAGGSHRYEERGLPADAAERVRCLYCASKPMVAMAVLSLLEQADVELEQARVEVADGRLVDEGGCPVADLLWHRSPFVGPTIWEALRFPLGTLEDELSRAAARAAVDGGRAGYSDVLAWFLLARLATALAGRSWVADLQRALRELVGPALWLRPDRELLELPVEAQITLLARHRGAEVPMVHALTRRTRALASPYLGAVGSFAAVVSWFQAFASHVHAGGGVTPLFPFRGLPGPGAGALRSVRPAPCRVVRGACARARVRPAGRRAGRRRRPLGVVRSGDGTGGRACSAGRSWRIPPNADGGAPRSVGGAWAWATSVGEHGVGDQPSRGSIATAWWGEVPDGGGGDRCRPRLRTSGSAGGGSGYRPASRR